MAFCVQLAIPFVPRMTMAGVSSVVLTCVVISVPFVFSGVVVALALTRFPRRVNRLYAADLDHSVDFGGFEPPFAGHGRDAGGPERIADRAGLRLVIWGQRDRYLGPKLAEPHHEDVPNLDRVERLPDASHWVHHDEAERVNELLVDFLAPTR